MSAIAARLDVAALPAWVDHADYDRDARQDGVKDGLIFLLTDTQADLAPDSVAVCYRIAYRIVTQAGAERGAQFSATFDPRLQRMEVHHIRVIRDGAVTEHAVDGAFDLMRREQNMERRVLDGRLTATLIIPDVRPGDLIESSWTISGGHPALNSAFSDWVALSGAASDIRYRLRAPADRAIALRTYGTAADCTTTESQGISDRRWRIQDAPRFEIEPLTPPWQALSPSVQISETQSWAEVSRLLEQHYRCEPPHAGMIAAAEAIKAAHPEDGAARMLAALALVRDKLRYLSLSLGEGGIVPRPLEQIWTTGYGDCKDAACLLVSLCRLAGIDAACALVATGYGPVLDQWLPSPTVFDHCIVRVRLDGRTWWIDPTRRSNENRLDQLFNPHLGWALALVPQDGALERMEPPEPRLLLEKTEKVVFGPRVGATATLTLSLVYRSIHADWMRGVIANQGLATVARHFEKQYRDAWPGARESEALQAEDDPYANVVALHATYAIATPWKKDKGMAYFELVSRDLANELAAMERKDGRVNDIHLGTPRILRRRLEMEMPREWNVTAADNSWATAGLKFWSSVSAPESNLIVQEQELTVSRPSCPPDSAKAYCDIVDEIRGRFSMSTRSPCSGDRFVERQGEQWWMSFGTTRRTRSRIAVIGWCVVMGLYFLSKLIGP